ncbi:putative hydroxymethylpyrimidine transporter CytX [Desulfacinum hydrothermale DSM 13146]|uniref:Putative hydroxymethylpyrimidine transporter CytX n=1 Tax=Desulfacinum hydrothermale DSM 13146 TaxID=1121390 RepID=A0A1W1X7R7_9BACT|nr:putative hydroxymethylpyrimidine transporter CytX [Desulfacinum hydrothermale]SMC19989.1 putative hydroxymethylpyrimidine transporter CytX [Desulfacinum hydrothermale DSM 13146]
MQQNGLERRMGGLDYFMLWAGAGLSLAEIWAGGLLVPWGLAAGLGAILLGHVIGNTFLAMGGVIGSREGIPTMMSLRPSFGVRGSYLPSVLNVVQLVGWTAVMLLICGEAAHNLVRESLSFSSPGLWIGVSGVVTTLWALGGQRHWKWLHAVSVTGLLVLCAVMTWLVLAEYTPSKLLSIPARPSDMGFMVGLDLVIAMPISWLPLVSDYSRFSTRTGSCFWGTWLGYFVVSSWMYGLGLAAALATGGQDPSVIVLEMMAKMGWVAPALIIVVFSTFTTTFLDIYSTAVSALNFAPALKEKRGIVLGGLLGTLLALIFPVTQYENFLLFIGSLFCPIFGVVLADYFLVRGMHYEGAALEGPGVYWYAGGFHPKAMVAWAVGFGIYQWALHGGWAVGSSLPGLLSAALLYWLLSKAATPR